MSIVLQSSGGGSITISEPATASNFTQTLPAATGTVMVAGNMPAFSVGLSSNQNISATTYTKIAFNSEIFDTANAFDNTTNYRFTPQVAGYYQLNAAAALNGTLTGLYILIYKNGSNIARTFTLTSAYANISNLVYLNGSSDYVEVYLYAYGSPSTINGNTTETFFSGSLVRSS